VDGTVAKIDSQVSFKNDESLISVLMVVPNEVALQLHDLESIIVHFGDDLRGPLFRERSEFLPTIDCLLARAAAP
jgi:hypothetical protein